MRIGRLFSLWALSLILLTGVARGADAPAPAAAEANPKDNPAVWPPELPGAKNGTVTITSPDFLKVPEAVEKQRAAAGAAPFEVAKEPPTVDLALHRELGENPLVAGTLWSSWGDICVGSDGKVYCGVGDHGKDKEGTARVYIYMWDPATRTLTKIADPNALAGIKPGETSFGKVHAGIVEGADRKIYYTPTLNDGGTAGAATWNERVPGGLIFQYDPATNQNKIVGKFDREVTATALLDPERNVVYYCLEGRPIKPAYAALGAFDLAKHEWIYTGPRDEIYADRNLALDRKGSVYFNGKDGQLFRFDPVSRTHAPTGVSFAKHKPEKGAETQMTMRASTAETGDGWIYGATMGPGRLFRYSPSANRLEMLGPDFLDGSYTTVAVLSPDERYVYYLPGAHGEAKDIGAPVVQYDVRAKKLKVLGFLKDPIEKAFGVAVAGTYGVKLSADGSTLYVNFNGHPREDIRPKSIAAIGFGLTSFAAIHIPASERGGAGVAGR